MPMKFTSPAFSDHGNIPDKYTCKGKNISPPLSWTNAPEDTKSFALICDDPDAVGGIWDHWILYDIPPQTRALPEHIEAQPELKDESKHGKNTWGRNDYGGPCPPSGRHRYIFKIYALDVYLNLSPGVTKNQLVKSMDGHILSKAEFLGYYQK